MSTFIADKGDDFVVQFLNRGFGGRLTDILKVNGITGEVTVASNLTLLNTTALIFEQTYAGTASYQEVQADLTLGAAAGKTGDTAFLSPVMGNLFGTNLSKTGNYLGGLIGQYSIAGTNATTYPSGAVLAGIGDSTTTAKGAVVAYIDGDGGVTTAKAMFKVMCNNSTAGSGSDFGVDLQDASHDGYLAVDSAFYKKAPLRLVDDVCDLVGTATPTDGVTGATVAGPGSTYRCTGTPGIYINTGTKATPAWKAITHA